MNCFRKKGRLSFQACTAISRLPLWLLALAVCSPASSPGEKNAQAPGRGATVIDAIQMTRWADRSYFLGGSPRPVGLFSPDEKQFVVIVKKGNLERNTNEYSLLLFRTQDAFEERQPRVLVTMSSSSNRDAINDVKWLDDNETVVFLGENLGETPAVYRLEVRTARLAKLTNHPTPITNYDISRNGAVIVYEADPPAGKTLGTEEAKRSGIVITTQYPSDLLIGDCDDLAKSTADYKELFVQRPGHAPSRAAMRDFLMDLLPLSVSPDGRYALFSPYLAEVPVSWFEYENNVLHPYLTAQPRPGTASHVQQYLLLDTDSLQVTPLLDAPMGWYNMGFAWNKDGSSVVLSGVYLPLAGVSSAEREIRKKRAFVAEVQVPGKQIIKVTDEALGVANWDRRTGNLFLVPENAERDALPAVYEKIGSAWRRTPRAPGTKSNSVPDVTLDEDANTPPRVFVSDEVTHRKKLLLDLNPQFAEIQFGKVEIVDWKASDGHEVTGGLYLPPNFTAGTRYPLVIQTHGFKKDRFWIDGPWSSAFAAQPLAASGFVVLQVGGSNQRGEDRQYVNTPEEAPRQMAAYEGAIDYLDHRGLIDPMRVGLIGFSRTVFYVEYTLTHSRYRFAAATVADGFDGGYMNFLLWGGEDYRGVLGGPALGASLASWLKNSPGFNLEKVTAAVRVEYYGPIGPLAGWQWFSGLSGLEKPVDFIWLPFGEHLLVKPWERLASQQGNVDWFAFWLKGEEARSQANTEQYERWEGLRARIKSSDVPSGN